MIKIDKEDLFGIEKKKAASKILLLVTENSRLFNDYLKNIERFNREITDNRDWRSELSELVDKLKVDLSLFVKVNEISTLEFLKRCESILLTCNALIECGAILMNTSKKRSHSSLNIKKAALNFNQSLNSIINTFSYPNGDLGQKKQKLKELIKYFTEQEEKMSKFLAAS